jgi:pteridine reductase
MHELPLKDRTILITGAARRIGRALARACAAAGANIVVHFHRSTQDAEELQQEIAAMGRAARLVEGDLASEDEVNRILQGAFKAGPLYGLVNNAAIFAPLSLQKTTTAEWDRHMAINLKAPFLLSKGFAAQVPTDGHGRIVNLVDWRALRPGPDHFPYTVSKAALAAMTHSMAAALAPNITVNALALGAILPPTDHAPNPDILKSVPTGRWAELSEVEQALIFLLAGPSYVTGEIIHVDGGRHLV